MTPRPSPRRLLAVGLLSLLVGGCIQGEEERAVVVPGGDRALGKKLVYGYACGTCHVIPGIIGAKVMAGPPLTQWAERHYIAGKLWNTPENLMAWIMNPQEIEPGTAMPDLGVSPEEARHMAAYLFTLGDVYGLGPPHPFPKRWLERLGKGARHGEPRPWSSPLPPEHRPDQP